MNPNYHVFCLECGNIHCKDKYSHLILFRVITTHMNNDFSLSSFEFQAPQSPNAIKYIFGIPCR